MQVPHRVVVVAFPPAQILDVTGPIDVFNVANECVRLTGKSSHYEIILAAPAAGPVATTSGVSLYASHDVHDADLTADTVILAGGPGARQVSGDPRLVSAIDGLCQRATRVGSVCTGAFALAATGALDGRRATTHWAHFDEFRDAFPQVAIDRDALFVNDGRLHSSAGITAGIDFALALIEDDLGRKIALQVARELVVFLKRPGGQAQFSAQLAAELHADDPSRFAELLAWMADNLANELTVDIMADRVAMSPRNFARHFIAAMNVTPVKHVQLLRTDAARRLLSESQMPLPRIAERCGFASAEAMRLAFQRHLNVSPSDFRARFQSSGKT